MLKSKKRKRMKKKRRLKKKSFRRGRRQSWSDRPTKPVSPAASATTTTRRPTRTRTSFCGTRAGWPRTPARSTCPSPGRCRGPRAPWGSMVSPMAVTFGMMSRHSSSFYRWITCWLFCNTTFMQTLRIQVRCKMQYKTSCYESWW